MKDKVKKILNFIQKRRLIIVIIALVVLAPFASTLSRYVTRIITNYYLESKNFYFISDKLSEDNPTYILENWSGVENFSMDITLESKKNQMEVATMDIDYNISYECEEGVSCNISKDSGTIYSSTNVDSITLNLVPTKKFEDGESTTFKIKATSTSPYVKTIEATFIIKVGKKGISYEIKDNANASYLTLNITNALSYYKIDTAFDNYQENDEIDYLEYLQLTDENKEKCTSAFITITFDPNVIILDTSNEIMKQVNDADIKTTNIDGTDYVNGISFKIDALTSKAIRFYKKNKLANYTYPIVNDESIIDLVTE